MKNISLAAYSFHGLRSRGMMDVFGYIESLKYRYHLDMADIWNGYLSCYDDDYLKKVREALDSRGLTLQSLCCDMAHPWEDDPAARDKNNQLAADCLRAAEILGAKTVRFDVGVRADDITEEQYDVVAAAFNMYARRGHDNGYVVGPENHWGASRRLSVHRELYRRVDHPGYGTLLHFGNWLLEDGMSLEETDLSAAPMAAHTHVSFECAQKAVEFLPKVRAAGYLGAWGLEHHSGSDEYLKVEVQLGLIRLAGF
jgi:sugar phosphate isomerase/epimerase